MVLERDVLPISVFQMVISNSLFLLCYLEKRFPKTEISNHVLPFGKSARGFDVPTLIRVAPFLFFYLGLSCGERKGAKVPINAFRKF